MNLLIQVVNTEYKKYLNMNNFIEKSAEDKPNTNTNNQYNKKPQTVQDLKNQQYSTGGNALVGGLIGAGIGGLGGYLFTPPDANEENLSEDKKYDNRLKNALLAATLGGLGGAGLSYGITEVLNQIKKDQKNTNILSNLIAAPFSGKYPGSGTGAGALLGVGYGALAEGTKIPEGNIPKKVKIPKYYGRRMLRGGAIGAGAGAILDIIANVGRYQVGVNDD